MKKNILLVDWNPKQDWAFLQGLEQATEEKWEMHTCDSSHNHGGVVENIIRYAKYFYLPLHVLLHRKHCKRVLTFNKFHGLILSFYFHLFHMKNVPEITVMTFIYKPKSGYIGKLFQSFVRHCVKSDYIQKLVVYSNREVEYYAKLFDVSEDKFLVAKLCIEDKTKQIPIGKKEDYFLSVGRSNRDYAFLLSSWNKNRKLKIVNESLKEKTKNPNIEILKDCHGDDYFRLLANCYAVIIPLADPHISSGQLVILQAMMYGKPIIVTKNDTLGDYIVNGDDGIIIDKTNVALNKAIVQLENEEYYHRMSMAERKTFHEKFSLYGLGTLIGETFKCS